MQKGLTKSESLSHRVVTRIIVYSVAANGLIIIISTLFSELVIRDRSRIGPFGIGFYLIIGLTLIYLSNLLSRNKKAAWLVAVPTYAIILLLNATELLDRPGRGYISWYALIKNIIIPAVVFFGLVLSSKQFTVKSDIRSFGSSIRFIVLVLAITLFYGVVGFELLDTRDFHQEIGVGEAFHRTIDQFDLTTNNPLTPYTRRATIFLDSLSVISVGAVSYGLISLFQPLRARFVDQTHNRRALARLLQLHPGNSEDFFKLWPHDKGYFLNANHKAGLAYHVNRGNALVVGDPAGDPHYYAELLMQFDELCYVNDWTPVYIHTQPKYSDLYLRHDFDLQKIGEEAIVDLDHFINHVSSNKYFRNIQNKFEKAGYKTEMLTPPHSHETVEQLKKISKDWLSKPGRTERKFIMGYFTPTYIQQSNIMVVLDKDSQIHAFMNQIHSFDKEEANFDMLRHSSESMGNINDFLLMNFIREAAKQGYKRLNLGLSPLSGLDKDQENKGLVDSALKFAYTNGDKLYSFSGLHRFKNKYEPSWSSRYIAYRGGISRFSKAIAALNNVWKVRFRN